MNKRCSPKQIAEAIVLTAMDYNWEYLMVENGNAEYFKSLDTFITTVYHFLSVFDKLFQQINERYFDFVNCVSAEEFVNFLAPCCEILSRKKDHFGLILTCSFASEALRDFMFRFKCFHCDSPFCKYLSEFLEKRFKWLENKSNWNSLMYYCREVNKKIRNRRTHKKHVPMEKPPTPVSSEEDVGNETNESNKKCKSDAIETGIINKLECPDINTEEVKNLNERLNGDTDKCCNQSIEIIQSKVISDVSQNDKIEKNKTQQMNGSYIESNIATNTTYFGSRKVTGNQTTDEINKRKRRSDTIEIGILNKMGCLDTDTEEVMYFNEYFSDDTDKICDETPTITPSKVIPDVSQNDEIEKNKPQEIKDYNIEKNLSSSRITEIKSWYYYTWVKNLSENEHREQIRRYYDLLMPDRQYKLEIFDLMEKCETEFDINRFNNKLERDISLSSTRNCKEPDKSSETKKTVKKIQNPVDKHKSDSQRDTEESPIICLDCKGKNSTLRYEQRKLAFQERYSNWSKVSDYLDRTELSDPEYLNRTEVSDSDSKGNQ